LLCQLSYRGLYSYNTVGEKKCQASGPIKFFQIFFEVSPAINKSEDPIFLRSAI
jgi:hypothetical protein